MASDTVVQDQRKRALQALERRFAVAEAEARIQTESRKRRHEEESPAAVRKKDSYYTRPSAQPAHIASATPPSSTSHKKDPEADDPIYFPISLPLHENLTTGSGMSDNRKCIAKKILHELFQSGDIADKYNQGSRSKKLDNWILLDNYVQPQGKSASNLRALHRLSKRSKRHMSRKQLKNHGAFELPEESQKFDIFVPIHELWKSYVVQLLKSSGKDQVAQYLLSADLHGAIMQVASCKLNAFIGVAGIMVRETAETFGIITQENEFKVVPKRGSVFMLQADGWKITLLGDKLALRNVS